MMNSKYQNQSMRVSFTGFIAAPQFVANADVMATIIKTNANGFPVSEMNLFVFLWSRERKRYFVS